MKSLINITRRFYNKILISIGILGVLLPISPWNMPITYRDSGVFLYIGWRILNGEIPYRDIWDHKPPIIFYINALGLAVSNGSRWGVWIIELIGLFISAYLGFLIIKKLLGELPAIFSLAIWLLTLVFVIQGGNLTTEYALPIQFALLWLFLDVQKKDKKNRHWFFIGLLSGIAFFTKQTTIGITLAITLYTFIQGIISGQKKQLVRNLLFLLFGFLFVTAIICLYFYMNNAFQQFWSAAFIYNFVNSYNAEFIMRLKAVFTGIAPLTQTGFFQCALIGYVIAFLWIRNKKRNSDSWSPLFWICLIDLPIEFIMVFAGGKTLGHYYMSMLPTLCILSSITFYVILEGLYHIKIENNQVVYFTGFALLVLLWSSFSDYYHQVMSFREISDQSKIMYIESHSDVDETVLIWGAETATNYFSQRRSPSRFVYQYPLYRSGYADEQMIEEYLQSLIKNTPQLIIDTNNSSTPMFNFPISTSEIQSEIAEIKSHYHVKEVLDSWTVYEYTQ